MSAGDAEPEGTGIRPSSIRTISESERRARMLTVPYARPLFASTAVGFAVAYAVIGRYYTAAALMVFLVVLLASAAALVAFAFLKPLRRFVTLPGYAVLMALSGYLLLAAAARLSLGRSRGGPAVFWGPDMLAMVVPFVVLVGAALGEMFKRPSKHEWSDSRVALAWIMLGGSSAIALGLLFEQLDATFQRASEPGLYGALYVGGSAWIGFWFFVAALVLLRIRQLQAQGTARRQSQTQRQPPGQTVASPRVVKTARIVAEGEPPAPAPSDLLK